MSEAIGHRPDEDGADEQRVDEGAPCERSELRVPVAGGELLVARYGTGPRTVLGIHGITASSVSLVPVARRLPAGWTLAAPDLRGRGGSAALPGPYGMRAHAEDCAAAIRAVSDRPVVVIGESMGGYVAVVLAASHPELVERLVLVDGGLPLPVPAALPAGLDHEALARMVLGPALERLSREFASLEEYLEFWRAHPAFGEDWNTDMEAYFAYDLEPSSSGFRSRVREAAVLEDASDLFDPALFSDSLAALAVPIALLRAPRNLLNQPAPLIPEAVAEDWCRRLPELSSELVEDVNHYTLMMGGRGAAIIAGLAAGR